ncbi:hypothetical protein GUJ93_ZPchr0010g9383 [Zizania palustris]|uniref:Uncharacterized protein n=1 Tax=Zizania palustris TaxID=103762 RepID=A0A8J6BN09_ZIZPA|nr:hypothetical protein GUJ93_ZPchr0010g9383 [Zizania palustris]
MARHCYLRRNMRCLTQRQKRAAATRWSAAIGGRCPLQSRLRSLPPLRERRTPSMPLVRPVRPSPPLLDHPHPHPHPHRRFHPLGPGSEVRFSFFLSHTHVATAEFCII